MSGFLLWYREQDSNLHTEWHLVLSQACLPIPSSRHSNLFSGPRIRTQNPQIQSLMLYQLSQSRLSNLFWLRRMELNHLPSGYEPDEIPFLHSALTSILGNQDSNLDRRSQSPASYHQTIPHLNINDATAEEGTRTLKP